MLGEDEGSGGAGGLRVTGGGFYYGEGGHGLAGVFAVGGADLGPVI